MEEKSRVSPCTKMWKDLSTHRLVQDYCKTVVKFESEWILSMDNAKPAVKSIDLFREQINDLRNGFTSSSSGNEAFGAADISAATCSLMAALATETDKIDLILSNLKKIDCDLKTVIKKMEKDVKTLESKPNSCVVLFTDFVTLFEELYFYYHNEYLTREFLIREPTGKLLNKWWSIERSNKINLILCHVEIFADLDFSCYSEKEISNLSTKSQNSSLKESSDHSVINEILNKRFIRDFRFYCVTTQVKFNKSKIKLNNCDDFFAMFSPRVLDQCSMNYGRLVLLTNQSRHRIIRAACFDVKLKDEIGLTRQTFTNFGAKPGDVVIAEQFNGRRLPADRMVLKPVGKWKLNRCQNFIKYLKRTEEGKYFTIGNRIRMKYFGNEHELVVIKVNGNSLSKIDESVMNTITKSIMELNIRTSTPIKTPKERLNDKIDDEFFYLTNDTKLFVETNDVDDEFRYKNFGGISESVDSLQSLISEFNNPICRKGNSIGVLIHGPSGVGKTILARVVAAENNSFSFVNINGSVDVVKKHFGESETCLSEIFEEAKIRSPTIILFDNIDHWCHEKTVGSQGIRIVNALMAEMKKLEDSDDVIIVLATTNKIYNVDPALRRPGMFDYEIEMSMPTAQQREDILIKCLDSFKHYDLSENDIHTVAEVTYGFTGCDLNALISEAFKITNEDILNAHHTSNSVKIRLDDILTTVRQHPVTCMRNLAIQDPKIKWSDIGGQTDLKLKIKQSVEWPIKFPNTFQRLGIRPVRGILLYGPPGCSKTLMAKAVATESGLNFMSINVTDVYSKYVGESEQAIRDLFHAAQKAAPSVLFIDEIDALVSKRVSGGNLQRRVLSQLLFEMDSAVHLHMTVVIAATNRPDMLDEALTRPGRFDRSIYVPLPDPQTRREIFKLQLNKLVLGEDSVLDALVQRSHNFSGAEISDVCNKVITNSVIKNGGRMGSVTYRDILNEVDRYKPSTSEHLTKFCERFKQRV